MTTSGISSAGDRFQANVEEFAHTIKSVLIGALGDAPDGKTELSDHLAIIEFDRFELNVNGSPLLKLELVYGCRPDSSGRYIAVTKSKFSLWPARKRVDPLVRLDYQDDMRSAPSAHWQVYGERGDLTWVLAKARQGRDSLGSLHIPVGGTRFRPCIEDFLQFAIEECGVDGAPGYQQALDDGRRQWRTRQLRTIVRDAPELAAQTLDDLGYHVTPPGGGVPETRDAILTKW